jgi:hypothetical protein
MEDAQFETWLDGAREELVPKLQESAAVVSLVPKGEPDLKFAIELGLSIMMNKPIIAVIQPGSEVPDKLLQVADNVLYLDDLSTPDAQAQVMTAIAEVAGVDDEVWQDRTDAAEARERRI